MMFKQLLPYIHKPALYQSGTAALWTDEHISKGMLEAHLNPGWDAATRTHSFVSQSADWIASLLPPSKYPHLLDLGCGPGIYAELFYRAGYAVTGVDFSRRSVDYAKEQARLCKSDIRYLCQDYLTLDYTAQFDVVTLIYCDYAVLSATDRLALQRKVYQALKPGGRFVFDVFTPRMRKAEAHTWEYCEVGGFFSDQPHLCLNAVYQYDDEDHTELCQYIVQTHEKVSCYHVWDHYFTQELILAETRAAGFETVQLYGDVAGKPFADDGETICVVALKP